MADAAIAADFHQALDIQGNFAAQIALHLQVVLDIFAQLADFIFGKILHARVGIHLGFLEDLLGHRRPNAKDVRQTNLDALFSGQVNTRNTCHVLVTPPNDSVVGNRRFSRRPGQGVDHLSGKGAKRRAAGPLKGAPGFRPQPRRIFLWTKPCRSRRLCIGRAAARRRLGLQWEQGRYLFGPCGPGNAVLSVRRSFPGVQNGAPAADRAG